MLDVDTFLTTLYVTVDEFCQSRAPKRVPGPEASLCASEVITLAIFARWSRFGSERDFYRYAETNLRCAFPTLPSRPQFNRLVRSCTELIEAFFLHLVTLLQARKYPYQALDGWPDRLTSDGPTAWDGTRALACSPPSTLAGS
jgi:hypothetical protein